MTTTNGTPRNGVYTIRLSRPVKLAMLSAFLFCMSAIFAIICGPQNSQSFITVWAGFVSIVTLLGSVVTMIISLALAFND